MNTIVASIVKLIVDFITRFFANEKLKALKETLNKKQETANELKSKSDTELKSFQHDYNAWLDIEERRLRKSSDAVQSASKESSPQPGKPASNNSGTRRSRPSSRKRNRRAGRASSRGRAK